MLFVRIMIPGLVTAKEGAEESMKRTLKAVTAIYLIAKPVHV